MCKNTIDILMLNRENILVQNRQTDLISHYSKMGFNWHSVIRFKQEPFEYETDVNLHTTKVFSQKIGQSYVDRVMDNLVRRKSISSALAFVEQDDYHNNHLHFTWGCPIELTRKQISSTMRTNIMYIRDIEPINNVEEAIRYFTKRLGKTGSYHNIYV
ncbi:MAG: hypothetical protein ABGW56_02740 [Flavobacteriaceae bacterium]